VYCIIVQLTTTTNLQEKFPHTHFCSFLSHTFQDVCIVIKFSFPTGIERYTLRCCSIQRLQVCNNALHTQRCMGIIHKSKFPTTNFCKKKSLGNKRWSRNSITAPTGSYSRVYFVFFLSAHGCDSWAIVTGHRRVPRHACSRCYCYTDYVGVVLGRGLC
jgi:hypothetical protein